MGGVSNGSTSGSPDGATGTSNGSTVLLAILLAPFRHDLVVRHGRIGLLHLRLELVPEHQPLAVRIGAGQRRSAHVITQFLAPTIDLAGSLSVVLSHRGEYGFAIGKGQLIVQNELVRLLNVLRSTK